MQIRRPVRRKTGQGKYQELIIPAIKKVENRAKAIFFHTIANKKINAPQQFYLELFVSRL